MVIIFNGESLHILILNYEYPPIGGGAGIVTKHLTEEFAKMNHKVVVITTWFFGEPEYFTDNNITVIRLKSRRNNTYESNPLEMLSWIYHARKYCIEHIEGMNFDICLANFTLPGGAVAKFLKKKYNLPYVILSHGHDIPWAYPKIMFMWHLFFYFQIKNICESAEKIILLSNDIKSKADVFLGEKHLHKNIAFNNGLYMHHFNREFTGEVLKIIFIGRLVTQKAPLVFLEAIKQLQIKKIPYEVQILGDGELKNKMKDFVVKNKLDHISFSGKISHAEVLNSLGQGHLLVSSSESEGMSLAILEALSSGVYVIATNVSGNDKMIIEDLNGNIVPVNQPAIIAEKIIDFYKNKLMKNYSFPGDYVAKMHDMFSWDKIAKQYENIFIEIID